jgi:hypothetical protein
VNNLNILGHLNRFFEGYPVSPIVAWLIEHVFWVKSLVPLYALKGLAVPTLQLIFCREGSRRGILANLRG